MSIVILISALIISLLCLNFLDKKDKLEEKIARQKARIKELEELTKPKCKHSTYVGVKSQKPKIKKKSKKL